MAFRLFSKLPFLKSNLLNKYLITRSFLKDIDYKVHENLKFLI